MTAKFLVAIAAIAAADSSIALAQPDPNLPHLLEFRSDPDEFAVRDRGPKPFTLEVAAGVKYDSNVSIIDIDTQTAADDFSAEFGLSAGYDFDLDPKTGISLGYSFDKDAYFEQTAFDNQLHLGSIDARRRVGAIEVGASYYLAYSRLDGDGFLRIHKATPYVAMLTANNRLYLRASYSYADKSFLNSAIRSATSNEGGLDAYVFVNGVETYLISGYSYESEDAADPAFDFKGHNIKTKAVQRFAFMGRKGAFRAGWRYETRNYGFVTPSIGVARDDRRHIIEASVELPLSERIFTEIEIERDLFTSNLPSADFNRTTAGVRLGWRL